MLFLALRERQLIEATESLPFCLLAPTLLDYSSSLANKAIFRIIKQDLFVSRVGHSYIMGIFPP